MPDSEPTVATAVRLLIQVPPPTELDKEVVPPTHKLAVPVIAPGVGITVTVVNT